MVAGALGFVCGSALLSCGDEVGCIDMDLDGFGDGCDAGPDCDDGNAARTTDCETIPAPDCIASPFATGCPCLSGAAAPCFPGPAESEGVGICRPGTAECVNQRWGLCDGSQLPAFEFCDRQDRDCDGFVDEGVASPCGDCDSSCVGTVWGGIDLPFDQPVISPELNLETTEDGWLTLAFETQIGTEFVWVPNSAEGTVSKIAAGTATEVARYAVGSEPSRVAVDYEGNAWVANRAFGNIPTVAKIAAAEEDCIDRNNNTTIETSQGPLDVLAPGEDECILFTVPVGPVNSVARALAVDGTTTQGSGGNIWVGLHEGQEVVVLRGDDGRVLERIALTDFKPYGANFDRFGTLWLVAQDGVLLRIDRAAATHTTERIEAPFSCFLLYSFAIHKDGSLFLSGHQCDQVLRFNPLRGLWNRLTTEASTRGVTVSGDDVYVSHTEGLLTRFSASPFAIAEVTDLHALGETPIDSIGLSADSEGALWIASGLGGPDSQGFATKVKDGDVVAHVPVGKTPHTQGDLTGSQLLGGFAPEGRLSRVFQGCGVGERTRWERLYLTALPGSNGSVRLEARQAATEAQLGTQAFQEAGVFPTSTGPFELSFPEGGVLEVQLVLTTSARDGAPRVQQVGLEWECPGPI